jgi:hypothetical protein
LTVSNGLKKFLGRTTRSIEAQNKKPVLTCLSESIPWEVFGHYLTRVKVKSARAMLAAKELIPSFYSKCWFSNNFLISLMMRLGFK